MTSPICPECYKLGAGYEEFSEHIVVRCEPEEPGSAIWVCPLCGFAFVAEDPLLCRYCDARVATCPGQLCDPCAHAVGPCVVSPLECARAGELPATADVLAGSEIDWDARESAYFAYYYGW